MPSINLRLTEEEHAALEKWAHGSHRSLQREIIFRLFSDTRIESSAGFVTPQGREDAQRNWGKKDSGLLPPPMSAPRGVCPMNTPAGTKCKACGKVHPL